MANLIQNNSKLIEQQKSQDQPNPSKISQSDEKGRNPKTVRIIKDQSGFGFNVRGQISGELDNRRSRNGEESEMENVLSVK
jgi:uncharacterized metal-binding protein YceD (DUF177 family)